MGYRCAGSGSGVEFAGYGSRVEFGRFVFVLDWDMKGRGVGEIRGLYIS